MVRERYEKMLKMLDEGVSGNSSFSLEGILQEAVQLFEEIREAFATASKEEQQEMIKMMAHLHQRLQEVSKITAKEAGLTEEELEAAADNPSNYTPEEWQAMQNSKKQLYKSARKLSEKITPEATPEDIEAEAKGKGKAPRPLRKTARRAKRKQWKKT